MPITHLQSNLWPETYCFNELYIFNQVVSLPNCFVKTGSINYFVIRKQLLPTNKDG